MDKLLFSKRFSKFHFTAIAKENRHQLLEGISSPYHCTLNSLEVIIIPKSFAHYTLRCVSVKGNWYLPG